MLHLATTYDLPSSLLMLLLYGSSFYPGIITAIVGVVILARKRRGGSYFLGAGICAIVLAAISNRGWESAESLARYSYLKAGILPFVLAALTWRVAAKTRSRAMLMVAAANLVTFLQGLLAFATYNPEVHSPNPFVALFAIAGTLVLVLGWNLLAMQSDKAGP